MQNQMGGHQLGGPINTGMQPGMPSQQGPQQQQQHLNQISQAQIAANQLSQTQLSHLQRKVRMQVLIFLTLNRLCYLKILFNNEQVEKKLI
jgi:hypothetical protein